MSRLDEFRTRVADYRASKGTLLFACIGSAAATMLVGFAVSGWVTSGTAAKMVEQAADEARTELAAAICVDRFLKSPDAVKRQAALKEMTYWKRPDMIEEGGWLKLPGLKESIEGAASECASRLIEVKLPSAQPSAG